MGQCPSDLVNENLLPNRSSKGLNKNNKSNTNLVQVTAHGHNIKAFLRLRRARIRGMEIECFFISLLFQLTWNSKFRFLGSL